MSQPRTLSFPKSVEGSKSLQKLYERVATRGSAVSATDHVEAVRRFAKWMETAPDQALASESDWVARIDDYVTYASRRGLSPRSIQTVVTGVKKWLIINGKAKSSTFESLELPKIIPTEEERTPTRQELQKILAGANIEDKVLALLSISTGLRVGTVVSLKFKHLVGLQLKETGKTVATRRCERNTSGNYEMVPVEVRERSLEQTKELPAVHVRADIQKARRPHFTFMTPETVQVLGAYVKERQVRGEELTPDSFLVVNMQGKGQMQIKGVDRRWRGLLVRAGLDEKSSYGLNKWHKLHFHTLRSYFSTQCINAGIEREVLRFFRGDRGGTLQGYFMKGEEIPPEYLEIAAKKYEKALESLTVTRGETGAEKVKDAFKRETLIQIAGYTQEQVDKLDLSSIKDEDFQKMVRERLLGVMANNGSRQKVIRAGEVEQYIQQGWEYVASLPDDRMILKLPM